ncbi:MAG: sel1 repeat family protein, partial [Candidatus Methanomethylophilus sp.]|nr:sel1 repeat family protein [Methanomethylophilus sp.]
MDAKEAEQLCVEAVQIITRESTDEENRRAADLFRSVADAGYSQGMFGLAELYMAGKGVEKDTAKAVELYRQAADKDNIPALFRLGDLYSTEDGPYFDPA